MRQCVLFVIILIVSSLSLKAQNMYKNLFSVESDDGCDGITCLNVSFLADYQEDNKILFVLSAINGNNTIYWQSFPLQHDFNLKILIPKHIINGNKFSCYIYNPNRKNIKVDSLNYSFEEASLPSYIPDNLEVKMSDASFSAFPPIRKNQDDEFVRSLYLDKYFGIKNHLHVYHSDNENLLEIGDNDAPLTNPISLYFNDNQYFKWHVLDKKQAADSSWISFSNENDFAKTVMYVTFYEDSPNVRFIVKTEFTDDSKISRYSLLLPFVGDDFVVYRANSHVDLKNCQDEYYLDHEGVSFQTFSHQLNFYHPKSLSSMQLDSRTNTLFLNLDYEQDHPFVHFPANIDTIDYYVDKSQRVVKNGDTMTSEFIVSVTQHIDLPRIMPIWDGYESGMIWTEHADWTDIRTHRAVCFGSEDVTCADSAVGGFVYYDIPVTKSVFYNNPADVVNTSKNKSFTGFHATIKGDSVYFDFLKQLKDKGFEICLHTPEQYTSTRGNMAEALAFMNENFGSPTWIDHGYNNKFTNNREDLICDGLNPKSPYYAADLWRKNGVRYLWNACYEEFKVFNDWVFGSNLQRPYPFWGDAFPKPRYMKLSDFPGFLMWTTEYTTEPKWNWDYYFSQANLQTIAESRSVFILHTYPAWVEDFRGFWCMKNGMIMAKEGFNKALERIAKMREKRQILPTTVQKYLDYQILLQNVDYRYDNYGNIILVNVNNETVKGITLISRSPMRVVDVNTNKNIHIQKRKSGDEYMVWFDFEPDEIVRIIQ